MTTEMSFNGGDTMAKYSFSRLGVESLRTFAKEILVYSLQTEYSIIQLKSSIQPYLDSIGCYAEEFNELIRACEENLYLFAPLIKNIEWTADIMEHTLDSIGVNKSEFYRKAYYPNMLDIYFIIDTSSKMETPVIDIIEYSIEELILEIRDISHINETEIYINTLSYSLSAKWEDEEAVLADDYIVKYHNTDGLSNIGEAFFKLNERLIKRGYNKYSFYKPIIFLFTRGKPYNDYKNALNCLKLNPIFMQSKKIAVKIGDLDTPVVDEFIIDGKIIKSCDAQELKKNIVFETM